MLARALGLNTIAVGRLGSGNFLAPGEHNVQRPKRGSAVPRPLGNPFDMGQDEMMRGPVCRAHELRARRLVTAHAEYLRGETNVLPMPAGGTARAVLGSEALRQTVDAEHELQRLQTSLHGQLDTNKVEMAWLEKMRALVAEARRPSACVKLLCNCHDLWDRSGKRECHADVLARARE